MLNKIPKSGLCNTNTFALVTLKAFEEILGKNGVNAMLRQAGLAHLIDNYPPHNRDKVFDFADYSSLMRTLDDLYGERGGRVMGLRAGRETFEELLSTYGAMVGVSDLAFRFIPLGLKLKIGINAMAKVFNLVSDQETLVEETSKEFHYIIKKCPICWGRVGATKPICHSQIGLLKEGLHWATGGKEFDIQETDCRAMGKDTCTLAVIKEPIP
jgi:bacteriochlorophyll 4-vinyl reductase